MLFLELAMLILTLAQVIDPIDIADSARPSRFSTQLPSPRTLTCHLEASVLPPCASQVAAMYLYYVVHGRKVLSTFLSLH